LRIHHKTRHFSAETCCASLEGGLQLFTGLFFATDLAWGRIWKMRKSLWIVLAALLAVIGAPNARADTITSGTITFTLGGTGIAPTAGSFSYDNTTNKFTSLTVVWDGITFDLSFGATQTNYLALTGAIASPQTWTAACIPSTVHPTVPCDGLLNFSLFAGTLVLGSALTPLVPTQNLAVGGGTYSVTQLVTTTPEPAAAFLLLGIGLVSLMRKRIAQGRQQAT